MVFLWKRYILKNYNIVNNISIKIPTGAPLNPINGTFPSNLCRVNVIASPTYFRASSTFGRTSLVKSSGLAKG